MLTVRWMEDKEGCLVANWYDHEGAARGGFVETVVSMDDYLDERLAETCDQDEEYEEPFLAQPRIAAGGRW